MAKLSSCAFVTLFCITSTVAWGEYTVWFPWANVANGTVYTGSPPWGGPNSSMYKKLDQPAQDNEVWYEDRVFYDTNCGDGDEFETYYDEINPSRNWQIYVRNATGTDFSGSNRLKLYVHLPDGTLMDENELFEPSCSVSQSNTTVIRTNASGDITWDGTNDCFLVEVLAYETVYINSSGNTNGVLNNTPTNHYKGLSIRIVQPNDYQFDATLRGQGQNRYRTSASYPQTAAPQIAGFNFGYEGIHEYRYDLTGNPPENTIVHPYFREQCHLGNDSAMGWSNIIVLVNGADATKDYDIVLRQLDGTVTNYTTVTLDANERLMFSPSQLMTQDDWPDREGSVEITGEEPVGVAFTFRFATCSDTTIYNSTTGTWSKPRASGNHCLPLLINPDAN